jgi:hypothetical protein
MALPFRQVEGRGSQLDAIRAFGGLLVVPADVDPEALGRAVVEEGARAIELHSADLALVAGLPIAVLRVASVTPDVAGLGELPTLRGLSLDAWRGHLDLGALPNLEWLGVTEMAPDQVGSFEVTHDRLRVLSIGRYRSTDLHPLAGLSRLESLSISDSCSLASLDGVGAFPALAALELAVCPQLATLDGIAAASALQSVVLETCNRVDDLAPLARLSDLRVVQVEMRSPPTLRPLVGHGALEFVWLIGAKRPADEIEALLENRGLRLVNVNRATWMRTAGGWLHIDSIYGMTPDQLDTYQRLVADLDGWKLR